MKNENEIIKFNATVRIESIAHFFGTLSDATLNDMTQNAGYCESFEIRNAITKIQAERIRNREHDAMMTEYVRLGRFVALARKTGGCMSGKDLDRFNEIQTIMRNMQA